MDDQILIIDDDDLPLLDDQQAGWKVMIVDDEPEVHRITKITLSKFEFDNRPIEFLHAIQPPRLGSCSPRPRT